MPSSGYISVPKHNTRLFWRLFKQQLGWPQIVVVLTIFVACLTTVQYAGKGILFSLIFAVYIVLTIATYRSIRHIERVQKNSYPNLFKVTPI
ncbi:hypothetical protein [Paraflavitalea pollutisoli]|uniref:hypothetical protein n=1 Tax=Paraflavitalea pollutisoli TaxID=3034143 RepID=UPI0023EB8608|nr:hypothetical protein [Paraflavitalea sp. H1-2-19X]